MARTKGAKGKPKDEMAEFDEFAPIDEVKPDSEFDPSVSNDEIEKEIKQSIKVVDGKRHLVFFKGRDVWWNPIVIETMLKSFPNDISFPEGTQYVIPAGIIKCATCG